jgi:prepilin-type N-terminal cleavage/methylation domain-containing protein
MRRIATKSRAGRAGNSGFTLIEVMIALVILGFGLLVMALMQLQALSGGRAGRHSSQAAVIARDQMEDFQQFNWTDAAVDARLLQTAGWTAPVVVNRQLDGGAGVEQAFNVSWRVTDVEANWLKNVDVRVTWSEPNFANRTVTISGVRYKDPW